MLNGQWNWKVGTDSLSINHETDRKELLMSHVVKLKLQVRDLSALELAAAELGCELVRDQKTHLYYAGNRAKRRKKC